MRLLLKDCYMKDRKVSHFVLLFRSCIQYYYILVFSIVTVSIWHCGIFLFLICSSYLGQSCSRYWAVVFFFWCLSCTYQLCLSSTCYTCNISVWYGLCSIFEADYFFSALSKWINLVFYNSRHTLLFSYAIY